ncbi:MAG: tetratricopeptide repeat protein [Acidobacteriia bacterium]|nr:tetratricopeptide repeat protein [Terriglobia bacterium]
MSCPEDRFHLATELWQQAYEHQKNGDFEEAIRLYKESIEVLPTAEAHTFLGWTYSFQGKLEEAIEECRKAIQVDADFGNPYNDIGAYLIQLGKPDEAIPWLEQATLAHRYESHCFPHMNLGRIYEMKGQWKKALSEFRQAVECQPDYEEAIHALGRLQARLN